MTKDKEIEELFLAQKPTFDDSAEFMAKLTKRLDAVEIVKQYQERTLRQYRTVIAVAFVVGIISGTISQLPDADDLPALAHSELPSPCRCLLPHADDVCRLHHHK